MKKGKLPPVVSPHFSGMGGHWGDVIRGTEPGARGKERRRGGAELEGRGQSAKDVKALKS